MAFIRALMGGLGGIAGMVAWYVVVTATGLWPTFLSALYSNSPYDRSLVRFGFSFLLSALGGGALVLVVGEKLGLFPSSEELDRQAKPLSLLSEEPHDRKQ